MNKLLLITTCLLASVSTVFAQDPTVAKIPPVNLKIDGINSEWQLPFNLFNMETGFMFSISNDDQNLYLNFVVNDEQKISKLFRAGWNIELKSKDKNNKFYASIEFPKGQMSAEKLEDFKKNIKSKDAQQPTMKREKFSLSDMVDDYKLQQPQIAIKGFNTTLTTVPFKSSNNINIDFGIISYSNADAVLYEVAIPLKTLSIKDLFSLKSIELIVNVNSMEMPTFAGGNGEMPKSGGGGRNGGGGHNGGGGRGGSGSGMDNGGSQNGSESGRIFDPSLFSKATLKQPFKLKQQ